MIQVSELTFKYAGADAAAVRGLNFRVDRGEIFGFLGPSGAGKSTTQRIIIGLLKAFRGEVEVLGRDLREWGSEYYERIGVAFELPNHYLRLTALENLTYFASLYRAETRAPAELLTMVGLEHDGAMAVAQFSKGMKTRLGVARALLNRPEVLFLDEPTVGLDPVNARRIKELILAQRREGRTVFLTTHDMTIADGLCDRVAFMVDGEIRLIDAPRALKLQHGDARVRVGYHRDGQTEFAEFPMATLGDDAAFLELLRSGTVETVHSLEASLEDVFIRITGRRLT